MKKLIVIIVVFCNYCGLWSQNKSEATSFYTVTAQSGLSVRATPSINGEKTGRFPLGEHLELIEDTGKFLSIIDDNQVINGYWFKVKKMGHTWDKKPKLTGYVFSGYLLKNKDRPYNPSDAIAKANTVLQFKNFNVTIPFYETETNHESSSTIKNDTMYVYESVFNELSDKLIHIKPKLKIDRVELFYTFNESVWEYHVNKLTPKKPYSWKGSREFKKLPLTRQMTLFPKIEYEKVKNFRQENLRLRDTMVHYPGEMGGTRATMSYKGRPCVHYIADTILKIIVYHSNGTVETKYINITLSYGC